jgi:hypothetical protein
MAHGNKTEDRESNQFYAKARQLALEIRSQRFAFAVLQGRDLLDYGARNVPPGPSGMKLGVRRLSFILELYAPSVVIARRTLPIRGAPARHAAHILERIREELRRRSIHFIPLDRNEVRHAFANVRCRTKHEIAAAVAEQFQELKPRLPGPRRPWEPERKRIAIFDALATAIAWNAFAESEDV